VGKLVPIYIPEPPPCFGWVFCANAAKGAERLIASHPFRNTQRLVGKPLCGLCVQGSPDFLNMRPMAADRLVELIAGDAELF
jgi:hypothetical protein